jgi:hypothetical protein
MLQVLQWDGAGELDELQRCLAAITQRVAQLESSYQSDFAVSLTTETVSALWLGAKETLEAANVPHPTQQALQTMMVAFAAQKNAERAPLRPEMNVVEARAATQTELARMRDLLGHFQFVQTRSVSSKSDGKKKNAPHYSDEDEDRQAARERAKGHGLASAIQTGANQTEPSRREGWIEIKSGSKWRKAYCKTSGHYL